MTAHPPETDPARAGAGAGNYVVSCEQGSLGSLDAFAAEWAALCAEGPCDEPFYRLAWVMAWVVAFASGAPLTFLTVRRDGRLRAILPLVGRTMGVGPVRLRWFRSTANSHFPRFDVIHGAGDADEVTAALWDFLQAWPGWDLLQFESAPGGGVAWRLLELAAADGNRVRRHRPDASPYVDVTRFPRGIDAIATSCPASFRSQLRRSLKRLRCLGEVEFRIVGAADEAAAIQAAIDAFYQMEASGWKGEAGTAILSDPATRVFYDRVIADARESGTLAICQLRSDGQLVATKLGLVHDGTIYDLKSGYDESYSKVSPGHLIKAYTLDAALELGVHTLDNCGRADDHKLAWTDLSRPFATCFVFNRTWRGRLAYMALFRAGPWLRQRLARYPLPSIVKRALA